MSKLTTFQELRHKCAEQYCPKDLPISVWAAFFGDCFKLHAMNEVDKKQAVSDIAKGYNVDADIITKTVQFQKDNGMIED